MATTPTSLSEISSHERQTQPAISTRRRQRVCHTQEAASISIRMIHRQIRVPDHPRLPCSPGFLRAAVRLHGQPARPQPDGSYYPNGEYRATSTIKAWTVIEPSQAALQMATLTYSQRVAVRGTWSRSLLGPASPLHITISL